MIFSMAPIAGLTLMDNGMLMGALSYHKRPHGSSERGMNRRRGRGKQGARQLIAQTAPVVSLGEVIAFDLSCVYRILTNCWSCCCCLNTSAVVNEYIVVRIY